MANDEVKDWIRLLLAPGIRGNGGREYWCKDWGRRGRPLWLHGKRSGGSPEWDR